jgi:hypothetical protein
MTNLKFGVQKIETRDLDLLTPFPSQDHLFPPCAAEDDEALSEDIRAHGLRQKIHILPENAAGFAPNTILFGHRRCAALLRIGEAVAKVMVRYDLADKDAATIEMLFIDDNDKRRQLSKLGRARLALRRFEIERRREPGDLNEREERDARDRVGQAIGMSGRNLQRYLNVLRAPLSVQQAYEHDQLTLKEADQIGRLPAGARQEIELLLEKGNDTKTVVAKFLGRRRSQPVKRGTAINRFIAVLRKARREIEDFDFADIAVCPLKDDFQLIQRVNKHCVEIIRSRNRIVQERNEAIRGIQGRCDR